MSAEAKQPQGLVPGRIVHYVGMNGKTYAAIVSFLHLEKSCSNADMICTLTALYRTGPHVVLDVPYNRDGHSGTWHWMFEGQENRYRSEPPSEMPTLKPQDVERVPDGWKARTFAEAFVGHPLPDADATPKVRAKMNGRAALLSMRQYMTGWVKDYHETIERARREHRPQSPHNLAQHAMYVMYVDAIDNMLDEAKA
jgi:hypothetical protein